MNPTVITRTEVHALLWSEPIKKIATRFGVRPIEIVNAAGQATIPRSPRGHWTRLADFTGAKAAQSQRKAIAEHERHLAMFSPVL